MRTIAAGTSAPASSASLVGAVLVHADGGAEGAAADHRYAGQLTESLYGAVFTVLAVHDRESGVNACGPDSVLAEFYYTVYLAVGGYDGGDAFAGTPAVVLQRGHVAVEAVPLSALGDAEHDNVIFLTVQIDNDRV